MSNWWKSRSLGEKVLLELVMLVVISQVNRFDVMLYIGAAFGLPELGVALAIITAILGLYIFILFITDFVRWLKSLKRGGSRSKTVAVALAILPIGIWSWLYTYKKDGKKFWLHLGLTIITFSLWGYVAWLWAIIDRLMKPSEYYSTYNQHSNSKTSKSVTVEFIFQPINCYVNYNSTENELKNDKWLIATFVFYLTRYFYICDSRQKKPLLEAFRPLFVSGKIDYGVAFDEINSTTYSTLSDKERKAAIKLFGIQLPVYLGEGTVHDGKKYGEYKYSVSLNNNGPQTHLHIGYGPDKVLLPISVLHFYHFVRDKISATNLSILNGAANKILDRVSTNNHPVNWLHKYPLEVLNDSGLGDLMSSPESNRDVAHPSENKAAQDLDTQHNSYYDIKDNVKVANFDELVKKASRLVIETGMASTALVQRRLQIEYVTAAKIMNELEDLGIVGKADGKNPRKVLVKN